MENSVLTKTVWAIDPAHSEVQFKVKHMMVSTVTGFFNEFEGTLESTDDEFTDAVIGFTANVDSISTNNKQRDEHLKSDDFFNASQFPKLSFKSKSFSKIDGNKYSLKGELTIRDNTHEITLDVEYNGTAVDPYGQTKAGFEISGKINRKDYGLKWGAVTEAGGVVVSDEVRLLMNIQLTKQ